MDSFMWDVVGWLPQILYNFKTFEHCVSKSLAVIPKEPVKANLSITQANEALVMLS